MRSFKFIFAFLGILSTLIFPFLIPMAVFASDETLTVDAEGADTDGTYVPTGWLAGWTYQKVFQIRHSPDGAQTNYQLPLHVYFGAGTDGEETINGVVGGKVYVNGLSQADFDDIRITKDDGTTLLDIWHEYLNAGVDSIFWVELDSIPASPDDAWFCVYYGNVAAPSVSDGYSTFDTANGHFFDDFERLVDGATIGGDWTENVAHVHISIDHAYSGTRSGKWVGGTSPIAIINQVASANIAVYYRVYKETAVTDSILRQGDGVNGFRLNCPDNEIYEWYNGAVYTDTVPPVSIVPDTWDYANVYDFDYTVGNAYINNATNTATFTFYASASYTNQISYTGDVAVGRDTYLDNFIVRNWTENTPRFGTWSAQATTATKYVYLNSDDGDGTYLNMVGTATTPLSHNFSYSASAATSISSVTLYFKVRYMSAGNDAISTYATIGGTTYYQETNVVDDTSYTLYSTTWAVNPATGLVWTLATINAATFGLEFQGTYRWTYAYMKVIYASSTLPTVVTLDVTDIGLTYASLNGEITDYGASTIDERGFVWDTTSHSVNPGNVDHTATLYSQNWVEAVSATNGSFYHVPILVSDTTYFYRACAHNSSGWTYGEEMTFRTIGTPTVTLLDASQVALVTARLNAIITYYGNQNCDVRFGWDTVTQAANANLYTYHSDWVNDTYITGDHPYVDISNLVVGTTYFFNVQVRNDFTTVQGTEDTFVTGTGALSPPTNLMAKPEMAALNLSWAKATNATGTLIRYSYAAYPATTTTGIQAYPPVGDASGGGGTSYRLTGLTSGRTVFISAWSYSNGTYSATYTTQLATTLAADENVTAISKPKDIAKWMLEPNSANLQKLPGHQLISNVATDYSIPETTLWFIIGIVLSVAFAGFVWAYDENHSPMAAMVALCIGISGGIAAGIYSGWMLAFVVLLGIGALAIAWRA